MTSRGHDFATARTGRRGAFPTSLSALWVLVEVPFGAPSTGWSPHIGGTIVRRQACHWLLIGGRASVTGVSQAFAAICSLHCERAPLASLLLALLQAGRLAALVALSSLATVATSAVQRSPFSRPSWTQSASYSKIALTGHLALLASSSASWPTAPAKSFRHLRRLTNEAALMWHKCQGTGGGLAGHAKWPLAPAKHLWHPGAQVASWHSIWRGTSLMGRPSWFVA